MTDFDFMNTPWWVTVSGAGTTDADVPSWADDYTRHRSGVSTTYTTVDKLIGRKDSIKDVNL